ncbi:MAG: hypothetical protein AB7I41_03595 [Candidatus Sericytochromatia bacterium]
MKTLIGVILTTALYLFLSQVSLVSVWPEARTWLGTGWVYGLRTGLMSVLPAVVLVWGFRRKIPQVFPPVFWLFLGNALFLACAMWGEWL